VHRLFDGFCVGKDLQFMLGEFPRGAWHICWTPGEHPPVLTEELNERTFLCRGKGIRHLHGLGGIRRVDLVLPCVLAVIE
jgi:hypothetical protein